MGIDKIKKKKKKRPGQLVAKSKNGKRPGYYGSDDYGSGEDGQGGSSSSSDNGGSDDNYMDYYVSPSPAPAPSYSVQDDIEDYATNVGSTASVGGGFDDSDDIQDDLTDFATNVMKTAKPEGGFEDDDDDGESLYVSPTQIMKEKEFAFKPAPFTGPYVDARDDPFTTAKNTNTGILSQIGSGLKTAAKFALPFVAGPIAGSLGLAKPYQAYSTFNRGKKGLDYISKLSGGKLPTSVDLLKNINFQPGTGNKPPAGTGFDNDNYSGSNNIIPKNVIASNVQKYSPEYKNRAIDLRDRLQPVQDRLTAKGQMTLASLNKLIEQFQV